MGWKQKRDKQNKNRKKVQSKFKANNKGRKTGQGGTGGFSKTGQLTMAGLKNFLGIGNPESNQAHRLKIGLQNNLDYSDMQEGPTIKINPKQWLGGFEKWSSKPGDLMPTVKTGWLQKQIPGWASGNWINHTLKSPKKLMPGDDGYSPTGTGSRTIDKDTAEYLNWIAKTNPTGMTVSDAKKLYANQIAEGLSLKDAMRFNPAETGSYYALIDDSEKENNTKNDMALTKNQQTIQDIYGTHLGRSAATEGLDYWTEQLDKGGSVEDIIRGIQSGSEYKERAKVRDDFASNNQGNVASEAYIDARVSPGGGRLNPNAEIGQEAPVFAADNTWSSPLMTKGNNTWTDELTDVYKDLKIGGASETGSPHYNTAPAANTGNYQVGVTHDAAGTPITNTTDRQDTEYWSNPMFPVDVAKKAPTDNYLTMDDLTKFFDERDSAKDTSSGGMDDFMKFMMLMNTMGGNRGGGYGGSQYGYGGLNPGGVHQAVDPWESMSKGWDFMKKSFGSGGSGGATSGTINAT